MMMGSSSFERCSRGRREGEARHYNRSEAPRMRWTEELHGLFMEAVRSLGGHHKATPKQILQAMGVKGLSISHVKSHLQMHRIISSQAKVDSFQPRESMRKRRRSHLPAADYTSLHGGLNSPPFHLKSTLQIASFERLLSEWGLKNPNNHPVDPVSLPRDDHTLKRDINEINLEVKEMDCELTPSSFNHQIKSAAGKEESVAGFDGTDNVSTDPMIRSRMSCSHLSLELSISSSSSCQCSWRKVEDNGDITLI